MIKGVLFDKDGTLLEFESTMHSIYTNVLKSLKDDFDVPEPLLQDIKKRIGYLPDRLTTDSILQRYTNPQIVEDLCVVTKAYEADLEWSCRYDNSVLFELIENLSTDDDVPYITLPGTEELLEYLKKRDFILGVATADTHDATVSGLETTNILHFFDYLGTSDKERPKPEVFMADEFCAQCRITPDQLLIVGDTENDMVFARNAGAHFVGVGLTDERFTMFESNGYPAVSKIKDIIDIHNL